MLDFIFSQAEVLITILTAVVTIASALANFTATETDNKLVAWLAKAVDFLALNIKK